MVSYFKPLRRKLGVITLVLACALTALWVRTLSQPLRLVLPVGGYIEYAITANEGWLALSKEREVWIGVRLRPNQILWKRSVPQSAIVLPLTLLSVWLVLSKTRGSQHASASEPSPC